MKALLASALLLALPRCGWQEDRRIQVRLQKHVQAAGKLERQDHLVEAIWEYQAAHELIQHRDKYRTVKMEIRRLLQELEHRHCEVTFVTLQFDLFKTNAARDDGSRTAALLKEGRELKTRVQDSKLPWLPELDAILEKLGVAVDKK